MPNFTCLSPIDRSQIFEGAYSSEAELRAVIGRSVEAQRTWRAVPLEERSAILAKAALHLQANRDAIGLEITQQMGRPIRYSPGELNGVAERASTMLALAPEALADVTPEPVAGADRWISREPLGVVAVLAPWNYPFLTSVNAIIPALAAGNSVILKHSGQTPLVALRYAEALAEAGLPQDVFQHVFLDHDGAAALVGDLRVDYVAFTGSVGGGRAVVRAMSDKFIGAGLELGGKDPAYVRADADVADAAENLADGAFFNSGQSCCGIERIYVDRAHHDAFVEQVVGHALNLKLGDPRNEATTLGPMVNAKSADFVRQQIADAVAAGATTQLPIDENWGSAYLPAQVLTGVTHDMDVMREESFGPVVGIMPVDSDDEAVALMNDSQYGLTASVWTADAASARDIGARLETGTVFHNRCDYLDPALAWTGVKNSGRGCTLSSLGYEQLTRPKSYHFKLAQKA